MGPFHRVFAEIGDFLLFNTYFIFLFIETKNFNERNDRLQIGHT